MVHFLVAAKPVQRERERRATLVIMKKKGKDITCFFVHLNKQSSIIIIRVLYYRNSLTSSGVRPARSKGSIWAI